MKRLGGAMKALVRRLSSGPSDGGNALIYVLWAAGLLGALATDFKARPNTIANRDFASFWIAGKLAGSGHAAQAYDPDALAATASKLIGTRLVNAYPYPPQFFFVSVPLSWLPLELSYAVWLLITGALFYLAVRPYVSARFPPFLAIVTPAAILNVTFGQTGFLYGALWLFAFSGSALAAGLLTVKPNLGFLVAIEAARRRQFLRTSAIVVGLIISSTLVFGLDVWGACLAGLATNHLRWIASGKYLGWYFQMTTPYLGYGLIGWLIFAAAAIFLITRRFTVFTAATAAFLISPYGFHYDMTVICIGFGALLFDRWRSMRGWQVAACAFAFLSPAVVSLGTWLVPPILLAGLYAMTTMPCGQKEPLAADEAPVC
ncbi:MAG TPA: glycosyltransferase family 87 protein [Sphingomicrobium sp.]|nr:glycosyltransferase family 87 protein [Sphingomicrobium sp.]